MTPTNVSLITTAKLGCKYPWYPKITTNLQNLCRTTRQIKSYWSIYRRIYNANTQDLNNKTGCSLLCHYKPYSVVGTPITFEVKADTTNKSFSRKKGMYIFPVLRIVNLAWLTSPFAFNRSTSILKAP